MNVSLNFGRLSMSYRGGSGGGGGVGGGGGPMGGGYKRHGRSSPYSRNDGGGNRRSWGNQPNRKRELTDVTDGRDGRSNYENSPQSQKQAPLVKNEAPPTAPPEDLHSSGADLSISNEANSANNSTSGKTLDTARLEKKSYVKSRLFVGNLPRDMRESEVKVLFEEHGDVNEVFVQRDKGYGFVRMVSSNAYLEVV